MEPQQTISSRHLRCGPRRTDGTEDEVVGFCRRAQESVHQLSSQSQKAGLRRMRRDLDADDAMGSSADEHFIQERNGGGDGDGGGCWEVEAGSWVGSSS